MQHVPTISQTHGNLASNFAKKIIANPASVAIAKFLNQRNASTRAMICVRAADANHKKLKKVERLKTLLLHLEYQGQLDRPTLLPIVQYLDLVPNTDFLNKIPTE